MGAYLSTTNNSFDTVFAYEIRVQGRLDAAWSDRMEGMAIDVSAPPGGPPVTTLVGDLIDQAALAGVLDQLYAMRMTVLSVTRLEDAKPKEIDI